MAQILVGEHAGDHGLADRPAAPGSNAEGGLGTIDLTSMIRTAQAVSGETGLTALIQTLMKIVLEHAGAERGLLLMPRADALRLEAEAVEAGIPQLSQNRRQLHLKYQLHQNYQNHQRFQRYLSLRQFSRRHLRFQNS